jgi:hypothetical protein
MSGTEAATGSFEPFQGPDPAGSSQAGADTEQDGCGQRHKWKQNGWPGYQSGYHTGNKRCYRGSDGIYEPQATAHKIARQYEANGTGGEADQ